MVEYECGGCVVEEEVVLFDCGVGYVGLVG